MYVYFQSGVMARMSGLEGNESGGNGGRFVGFRCKIGRLSAFGSLVESWASKTLDHFSQGLKTLGEKGLSLKMLSLCIAV